jgi:hypothetical protein
MDTDKDNSKRVWWNCQSSEQSWPADAALDEFHTKRWWRVSPLTIEKISVSPAKEIWWLDPDGFVHSTPLQKGDKS